MWEDNAGCVTKCVLSFSWTHLSCFQACIYVAVALGCYLSPKYSGRDAVCHFYMASWI